MNKRVKTLREALGLSQEALGEKIGVTRASISNIEKGSRNMSEQTIKSICREFNVNYFWLRDGEGDMFIDIPDTVIEELVVTYDMSDWEKMMIEKYLKLSKNERETAESIMKKMFNL